MKYENINDFIKSHLRYQQHWKKKIITMSDAKWQPLTDDTWLGENVYANGSQFKVFETTNFGWVVFHPDTRTPDGNKPNKLILKW